eukprot:2351213-Pleurochrysis_carterae.AAC.1
MRVYGSVCDYNAVDIQQIRDRPFVFHVPARCERVDEFSIERDGSVVGVKGEQVIHVASQYEVLERAVNALGQRKDTWIRIALSEIKVQQPWKK